MQVKEAASKASKKDHRQEEQRQERERESNAVRREKTQDSFFFFLLGRTFRHTFSFSLSHMHFFSNQKAQKVFGVHCDVSASGWLPYQERKSQMHT